MLQSKHGGYEAGEFKIDDSCINQVPDGAEVFSEGEPLGTQAKGVRKS